VKIYHVEFDVLVPERGKIGSCPVDLIIPEKDVIEWIRFMCGDRGKLPRKNPLYRESFDPIFSTFKAERKS